MWFDGLSLEVDGQPVHVDGLDLELDDPQHPGFSRSKVRYPAAQVMDYSFDEDSKVRRSGRASLRIAYNPLLDEGMRDSAGVVERLEASRARYEAKMAPLEVEEALQNARLVHQALSWRADVRERDRWMAENLRWLREVRFPGAKIAVSAANVHVCRCPRRMGELLASWYGDAYAVIGFMTLSGRVMYYDDAGNPGAEIELSPAGPDDLSTCLAGARAPVLLLDLRSGSPPPCAATARSEHDLLAFVRDVHPAQWLGRPSPN